jgi:hypothetical protein
MTVLRYRRRQNGSTIRLRKPTRRLRNGSRNTHTRRRNLRSINRLRLRRRSRIKRRRRCNGNLLRRRKAMGDRRMTTRAADKGKSFLPQRTQRDTKFDLRVPFCFGCVSSQYRRRMKLQEVTSEERFSNLAFLRVPSCPLWLILQLTENLRRGFQRQRFRPDISSYARFFQAVADVFFGIVFF